MNIKEQLRLQEKFNSGSFSKLAKPLTVKETKTLIGELKHHEEEKPVKQTRKTKDKK